MSVDFILVGQVEALSTNHARRRRNKRTWPAGHAPYPHNWVKVSWVLKRIVGYRCEWCGNGPVSVHHMGVPWPTGRAGSRFDKHDLRRENLYVLCDLCHSEIEEYLAKQERNQQKRWKWKKTGHDRLGVGTGLVVYVPPGP